MFSIESPIDGASHTDTFLLFLSGHLCSPVGRCYRSGGNTRIHKHICLSDTLKAVVWLRSCSPKGISCQMLGLPDPLIFWCVFGPVRHLFVRLCEQQWRPYRWRERNILTVCQTKYVEHWSKMQWNPFQSLTKFVEGSSVDSDWLPKL